MAFINGGGSLASSSIAAVLLPVYSITLGPSLCLSNMFSFTAELPILVSTSFAVPGISVFELGVSIAKALSLEDMDKG